MTVIQGTQICIPAGTGPKAQGILKGMNRLLWERYHGRVTRRRFLARWSRLRKALFLTDEYQEFRKSVLDRCSHICEMCNADAAVHVHHHKRVATDPFMSMVMSNVQGVCKACHESLHGA